MWGFLFLLVFINFFFLLFFCGFGGKTQNSMHIREAPYHWASFPVASLLIFEGVLLIDRLALNASCNPVRPWTLTLLPQPPKQIAVLQPQAQLLLFLLTYDEQLHLHRPSENHAEFRIKFSNGLIHWQTALANSRTLSFTNKNINRVLTKGL